MHNLRYPVKLTHSVPYSPAFPVPLSPARNLGINPFLYISLDSLDLTGIVIVTSDHRSSRNRLDSFVSAGYWLISCLMVCLLWNRSCLFCLMMIDVWLYLIWFYTSDLGFFWLWFWLFFDLCVFSCIRLVLVGVWGFWIWFNSSVWFRRKQWERKEDERKSNLGFSILELCFGLFVWF